MFDESDQSDRRPASLATMPGILVALTLGLFFVVHAALFLGEGSLLRGPDDLEKQYLEASAEQVRGSVGRARSRLGLEANRVVQREGELYFLPDIEHVTGRSFLRETGKNGHVVLRREGREERAGNPLPAILDFDRNLRSRGIRLVLLPVPSKAMFAGPGGEPLRNEGFAEFLEAMEKNDVPVFDLAPHFAEYAERGNDLFLKTDSHWTPECMRIAAFFLAALLEREGLIPAVEEEEQFYVEGGRITGSGDLAKLLDRGNEAAMQETILASSVTGHRNRTEEIVPWKPKRDAPLLLLGDSFTNVFSLKEMGWGEGGGLAEVLSQSLDFSIDRIARNADGAFASRQELSRDAGRLEGKTVVVWQFAARELSFGDWKVLPLPERAADSGDPALGQDPVEIEGTIAKVAPVPPLTRTPYRRAVMELHLVNVKNATGEFPQEVVLHGLGVENRVPTAMTKWKAGQVLKVKVVPWREAEERFGRLHRFALDDPEFELIDAVRVWMVE